jgi:transglutaminase-like putative cysteine protease
MKWFKFIIIIIIFGFLFINADNITDKIAYYLRSNPKVVIDDPNEYYKDTDYKFVKLSGSYMPYSKQDLYDIFYSILDSGYETFTFYCPFEYDDCIEDITLISQNQTLLTNINNFVNPFNSFSNIKISSSSSSEINIEVTKLYSDEEIEEINKKMDEIENEIYTDDMSVEDKILAVHDYIVNNTIYDENAANKTSSYKSNKAYGALIQGYAVCGGYADAMALFLDRLNVPNYKVSSETHVWNAVYINESWLHLDLTWDDPVSVNSNVQTLTHKFYLIDTPTLESYNIDSHDFNKSVYQEVA